MSGADASDTSFLPGFAPNSGSAPSTCDERCWHALEEVCVCSCGGKNHGILKGNSGNPQPNRTRHRHGKQFKLMAVIPGGPAAHTYIAKVLGSPFGGKAMDFCRIGEFAVQSAPKHAFRWPELDGYPPTCPRDRFPHLIWKRIA